MVALQNLCVDLMRLIAGICVVGAGIALATANEVVKASSHVLAEPVAEIGVRTLADTSISIAVKPWVKVVDFGPAGAEINRAIVERLRTAGVVYPAAPPEIRLVGGKA